MKKTKDGNGAAARIAYKFSEVCCIYPITPSSNMAESVDEMSALGEKNIFKNVVKVVEMQSEAGAAGALHGALSMGALASTFTASQGLLLMIPNMYKMAGELLPAVFHVSARALATHALSIFGDHSDVMSTRSTGFCMLCSNSVQEAEDLALIAHTSAIKASLPFMHFFDGFRTSHEIQKIEELSEDVIEKFIPKAEIEAFKKRALNPNNPHTQGTAENPDIFFQHREGCNTYYNRVYGIVETEMQKLAKLTGRSYAPFDYVGSESATHVVVMMGSGTGAMTEYLSHAKDSKLGLVKVRLYRPWNKEAFLKALPSTVKKITVLDRTKESGSVCEPLCEDVIASLNGKNIKVIGGRYGLGGKDFTPGMAKAVVDNLKATVSKENFTVGITDDVTNLSLPVSELESVQNAKQFIFYGLGSDGTVSANKNTIKIIGDETDKYVQGYFEYDSKKSGSLTKSHLRISDEPILSSYLIKHADLIAIHNFSFVARYPKILDSIKTGGNILLNTVFKADEINNVLPNLFKQKLKEKKLNLYIIDGESIAKSVGLGNKVNVVMQSAFFKVSNIIDFSLAETKMKEAAKKSYGKKGDAVIAANYNGIEQGANVVKVDVSTLSETKEKTASKKTTDKFYNNIMEKIDKEDGDSLKVSDFSADGYFPTDTTKFEKRGIASSLPCWMSDKCIQCGKCIMACPHAAFRSVVVKDDALKSAPESFKTKAAIGVAGCSYRVQVSPLDCTGCGVCENVCPVKDKAIVMQSAHDFEEEKKNYNYALTLANEKTIFQKGTMKGIQFEKPYFEFSGACAGCGETPYIKLASQLFGKNMIIANATGCSSIYGGSAPSCPYSKDSDGCGPAWANSLFEDNAEFGMGMAIANELRKDKSSIWIIGGDGWAYDIGFGGLDHLLASNENVNILVLDSEVYSNTGGQSSKSTQKGAMAKFAAKGKQTKKKNLAEMAISYQNAYVASVSMGSDPNQCIKAFIEAESYNGPSLIIAYTPCINHGYDMSKTFDHMKQAVDSGYTSLFRYHKDAGMTIDSKEPTVPYRNFLMSETRFSTLAKQYPEEAEQLFRESEEEAKQRREQIARHIKNI